MATCQEHHLLGKGKTIVSVNFMHIPGRKDDYQNTSGLVNIYQLIKRFQWPYLTCFLNIKFSLLRHQYLRHHLFFAQDGYDIAQMSQAKQMSPVLFQSKQFPRSRNLPSALPSKAQGCLSFSYKHKEEMGRNTRQFLSEEIKY